MTVILALEKRRQEDLEFSGSLGYMPGACLRNQGLGMSVTQWCQTPIHLRLSMPQKVCPSGSMRNLSLYQCHVDRLS